MKVLSTLALAATVILAASCGLLGQSAASYNPAASTTANATTGTNAGSALLGLYSQYKTDGKLDLGNINNIINLATLASNCQGLKSKSADTGSFLSGLISGSKKLVNQDNGSAVLNGLKQVASANLNSVTNAAATYAASTLTKASGAADNAAATAVNSVNTGASGVTSAVSALSGIFSAFAK